MENPYNMEYLKSRFRCPICGELAGLQDPDDESSFTLKGFFQHVNECRNKTRVKPSKLRYTDDNE
jgi:hypothetical protein